MDQGLARATLVPRASRPGCCQCGDVHIEAVCHQCGRPLCKEHRPQPEVLRDVENRPESAEYTGLGLEATPCGDVAVHCPDCEHVVRMPRRGPLLAGVVTVVGGRFLQQELPGPGLALVVIGALLLGLGGAIALRRLWEIRRNPPLMPWVPRLRKISVSEEVEGVLSLDAEGLGRSRIDRAEGSLRMEAIFGESDRSIFERYVGKHHLSPRADLPFRAGFLVFKGSSDLRFETPDPSCPGGPRVLPLDGTTTEEPARRVIEGSGIAEWTPEWKYRIDGGEPDFPVQLVPCSVPESGGQILALELRWGATVEMARAAETTSEVRRRRRRRPELQIASIEGFEVRLPFAWGEVESAGEEVFVRTENDEAGGLCRVVTWRKVLPTFEESASRCRRFQLELHRRVDLDVRLQGSLVLEFRKTWSGIEDVAPFFPLGHRVQAPCELKTRVRAAFDLHLGSLCHRETRVFPDPKNPDEKVLLEPLRFDGVAPGHTAVIALGRTLTERGYYLKSVAEDPPRSGTPTGASGRLWDLSGRIEDRVFPVEFHLTVSGEEAVAGGGARTAGRTAVTLTVQGAFSHPRFREKIETAGQNIRDLVQQTFEALQAVSSPPVEPHEPHPWKELGEESESGLEASNRTTGRIP